MSRELGPETATDRVVHYVVVIGLVVLVVSLIYNKGKIDAEYKADMEREELEREQMMRPAEDWGY